MDVPYLREAALRAGRLRQRIVIKTKNTTRDNMGGEVNSWTSSDPIPAEAEPIRGREYVALQQSESELEVKFTIRYRTGITPDCRIVWREADYELVSPPIDVGGRKRVMELMCRTAQNDG